MSQSTVGRIVMDGSAAWFVFGSRLTSSTPTRTSARSCAETGIATAKGVDLRDTTIACEVLLDRYGVGGRGVPARMGPGHPRGCYLRASSPRASMMAWKTSVLSRKPLNRWEPGPAATMLTSSTVWTQLVWL